MRIFFILCLVVSAMIAGMFLSESIGSRSQKSTIDTLRFILTECQRSNTYDLSVQCFRGRVSSLVDKKGANEVIDQLDKLFILERESGSMGRVSCHDIAHVVGQLGVAKEGDIGHVLARCTNACGYGCQHGALLGAVQKNSKVLEDLTSICASVTKDPFHPQDYDACVHGLGHAISDIASLEFSRAFALCDHLVFDTDKKTCAEGVFMEIIDSPSLGHARRQFTGTVEEFCTQFTGIYREACFETGGLHVFAFTSDSTQAADTCSQMPSVYTNKCFVSLMNTLYYVFGGQVKEITAFCGKLSAAHMTSCFLGAIQSDVVTNRDPQVAIALCKEAPQNNQIACFQMLGEKVEYVYGRDTRTAVCQRVPTDVHEACVRVTP